MLFLLVITLIVYSTIERKFLLDKFIKLKNKNPLLLIFVDEILHLAIAIVATLPLILVRIALFIPLLFLFSIVDIDHILTAKSLRPRDLFFEAERTPLHSLFFGILIGGIFYLFSGDIVLGAFSSIVITAHILRDSLGNGTPVLFPIKSSIPWWLSAIFLSLLPILSYHLSRIC